MGGKGSLPPNSTRVRDGEAHRDDAFLFVHSVRGELWLHFRDNFLIIKSSKKISYK
jgi:hypothetical protein